MLTDLQLTHSLTHSHHSRTPITHSLTHSLAHLLTCSHSLTCLVAYSFTHLLLAYFVVGGGRLAELVVDALLHQHGREGGHVRQLPRLHRQLVGATSTPSEHPSNVGGS